MGLTLGPAVRPKLRKKEKRIVAEMEDWGHIKFWPLDLGPRIAAPHVPASSWRIGVSYLYHSLSFYIHLKSLQKSPPQKQMPLYHILSIHYHYHTLLTILYHCFCLKLSITTFLELKLQELKAQLVKTQELLQLAVKEKENTQKIIEVPRATVYWHVLMFFPPLKT
jgi:hypothetical protein